LICAVAGNKACI